MDVSVVREPYPEGEAGIQKSLKEMCAKIRESAPTPVFRSFAGNILRQAGFPRSSKEKAAALYNHVKKTVGYTNDPPGTELIQNPKITLCVEGAPVCIPIGDCDDMVTALASLCAAAGLEVEVVRQFFGKGHQQHVICEVKLEDRSWLPLDSTTHRFGPGEKANASYETRMNPWEGEDGKGLSAEFIGIGSLPVFGLGEDGHYHQIPNDLVLGADEPPKVWYDVGQGVQASRPMIKPFRGLGNVDRGLGAVELPKLSTTEALAAGGAIIVGSAILAAIIRKVKR